MRRFWSLTVCFAVAISAGCDKDAPAPAPAPGSAPGQRQDVGGYTMYLVTAQDGHDYLIVGGQGPGVTHAAGCRACSKK